MNHLRLLTASVTVAAALLAGGAARVAAAPAPQDEDALGVIEGSVFLDADADGRFDPDEQPLEGFEILLDGPDERSAMTLANGRYRFEDLPAGSYTVRVERDDEQRETYVSSIRYENLEVDGTLLVGIDFGLQERDAVAAEATEDAMDEADEDAGDETAEDEDMTEETAAGDQGDADDGAADEATMDDDDAADEATMDDDAEPEMTAANMLPALREMLQGAAAAGQTVDDLDPAARKALDDAVAELSDAELAELQRAMDADEELRDLARETGADVLLAAAMDARAAARRTSAPAQVHDMPQTGAEDLLGWQGLVGLIALLALLGAAGMVAERRGA